MTRVPQLLRIIPIGFLFLLSGCHDAQAPTAPTGEGPLPALAVTGFQLAQVSAGFVHSCGVISGGQAFCWGRNNFGQLGNGTSGSGTDQPAPVPVVGGLTFTQVTSGGFLHTCALSKANGAYCWGDDAFGQLGNGATTGSTDAPSPVSSPAN
jgi:alpha-tubulin suppressor-like RCC1 family protein